MVGKIVVKNEETIVINTATGLDGTGRSGKGPFAKALETYDNKNVVSLECGVVYRTVTDYLLGRGAVVGEQSGEEIAQIVEQAAVSGELSEVICGARDKAKNPEVYRRLYGPAVRAVVSRVSPVDSLRRLVKADLCENVTRFAESPRLVNLVLDGRNLLAATADLLPQTKLDIFMQCSPEVAAARECRRDGFERGTPEYRATYDNLVRRNKEDAERAVDPVKPRDNAIELDRLSGALTARQIGRLAPQVEQQVIFDTSEYELRGMACTARGLFQGAKDRARELVAVR